MSHTYDVDLKEFLLSMFSYFRISLENEQNQTIFSVYMEDLAGYDLKFLEKRFAEIRKRWQPSFGANYPAISELITGYRVWRDWSDKQKEKVCPDSMSGVIKDSPCYAEFKFFSALHNSDFPRFTPEEMKTLREYSNHTYNSNFTIKNMDEARQYLDSRMPRKNIDPSKVINPAIVTQPEQVSTVDMH